ncbi:MAG: ABC transporter substrate-binding protein [Promethearchaeota archaeon]
MATTRFQTGFLFVVIGFIVLLLGSSMTQPISSGIHADWTYPSGYDPHGGYVDRLTFKVYPSEETASALLALVAGDVYSYDERIPHQTVRELQTYPAIEVTSELGSDYRQFTLNCQRFPTNISGYRRALAYALNKSQVVENARDEYATVMDNPIPLCFEFWSYEEQMTEHFYLEDIANANATLDAAHIIDTPDSPHAGWRYFDANMDGNYDGGVDKRGDLWAPDGLKIELWTSAGYYPDFLAALSLLTGMEKCGLHAEIVEVDYNALVAGLETGEYNIGNFAWNINSPGTPTLLYDFFYSEAANNLFFYRFNNSEYDYNVTQFMNAPTRLEARNWAWNCCAILMAEMPMIVCYNDWNIHAVRTDIWEGYIPQVGVNRMGGNPYTYQQVRLKESAGGPFGCFPTEYVTVLSEGMYLTNTILDTSSYTQTVLNLIYSKLWQIDPLDPLTELAPDLAYNWTLTPTTVAGDIQEGMKYTFHLYENVTWHDGTPFTAEDVQYSLMTIHPWGTITAENVASIYRVDIPDNYTVEIYSNETGYVTFAKATDVQILPKHIWSPYEAENFTWSPATAEDLTGTGCYQWVTRVVGQYIILDRYADWHFAVIQPPRPPCLPTGPGPLFYGILVIVVIIILVQVGVLGFLWYRHHRTQAIKGVENK